MASIDFIRRNTTVPVPNIVCAFSDRDSYYVLQEKVQNVSLASDVPAQHMHIVTRQIEGFIAQMQRLKSWTLQGTIGPVCLPLRFVDLDPRPSSVLRFVPLAEGLHARPYVFCHGDLNGDNILVDPITYEVKCILDWENAGFYPPELEGRWWTRQGPSCPIGDEVDDTEKLKSMLWELATPESAAEALRLSQIPRRLDKLRAKDKRRRTIPQKPFVCRHLQEVSQTS